LKKKKKKKKKTKKKKKKKKKQPTLLEQQRKVTSKHHLSSNEKLYLNTIRATRETTSKQCSNYVQTSFKQQKNPNLNNIQTPPKSPIKSKKAQTKKIL